VVEHDRCSGLLLAAVHSQAHTNPKHSAPVVAAEGRCVEQCGCPREFLQAQQEAGAAAADMALLSPARGSGVTLDMAPMFLAGASGVPQDIAPLSPAQGSGVTLDVVAAMCDRGESSGLMERMRKVRWGRQ
jgi:hypothetical protein